MFHNIVKIFIFSHNCLKKLKFLTFTICFEFIINFLNFLKIVIKVDKKNFIKIFWKFFNFSKWSISQEFHQTKILATRLLLIWGHIIIFIYVYFLFVCSRYVQYFIIGGNWINSITTNINKYTYSIIFVWDLEE